MPGGREGSGSSNSGRVTDRTCTKRGDIDGTNLAPLALTVLDSSSLKGPVSYVATLKDGLEMWQTRLSLSRHRCLRGGRRRSICGVGGFAGDSGRRLCRCTCCSAGTLLLCV